jgi:hypothetical protein
MASISMEKNYFKTMQQGNITNKNGELNSVSQTGASAIRMLIKSNTAVYQLKITMLPVVLFLSQE